MWAFSNSFNWRKPDAFEMASLNFQIKSCKNRFKSQPVPDIARI